MLSQKLKRVAASRLTPRISPEAIVAPDREMPGAMELIVAPGAARYLAARQEEMERLVRTFPDVWPTVAGPGFRRRLATVVAEIEG